MNFKEDNSIIKEIDKSKIRYAISVAESLIKCKDASKTKSDLDLIWKICGFSSKKKFDDQFKMYKGYTLSEYCTKINPNCKC